MPVFVDLSAQLCGEIVTRLREREREKGLEAFKWPLTGVAEELL